MDWQENTRMTRTIQIYGTKRMTAVVQQCFLCPGNAWASNWAEHMKRHLSEDELKCTKCHDPKPLSKFGRRGNIHPVRPICQKCRVAIPRSKRSHHATKPKDYYQLRNPVVLNSGHGRPPKKEKVAIYSGKGGMGSRYAGN